MIRAWARVWINVSLIVQVGLGFPTAQAASMTEIKEKIVINALFNRVMSNYMLVTSFEDFDRIFLASLQPSDRTAIAKVIKKTKLPKIEREGEALVVKAGTQTVKLTWPNPSTKGLLVNGTEFSYNPEKTLMSQIEELSKRMGRGKKSALWKSFLPEAEAEPITITLMITIAVGAIIGSIVSNILMTPGKNAFCQSMDWMGWCGTLGMCEEWKKDQIAKKMADAPSLDAVANQVGADKTNVLSKWDAQDLVCPNNNDGKERYYRGRVRAIEVKDGQKQAKSEWFEINVKLNPDGTPTDLTVTRSGVDPKNVSVTNSEAKETIAIQMAFDPTTRKPVQYSIPNEKYKEGDLLASPLQKLSVDSDLTPEQKDRIANAKDLVAFINYRIYKCVVTEAVASQAKGIELGSPVLPASGESAVTK